MAGTVDNVQWNSNARGKGDEQRTGWKFRSLEAENISIAKYTASDPEGLVVIEWPSILFRRAFGRMGWHAVGFKGKLNPRILHLNLCIAFTCRFSGAYRIGGVRYATVTPGGASHAIPSPAQAGPQGSRIPSAICAHPSYIPAETLISEVLSIRARLAVGDGVNVAWP